VKKNIRLDGPTERICIRMQHIVLRRIRPASTPYGRVLSRNLSPRNPRTRFERTYHLCPHAGEGPGGKGPDGEAADGQGADGDFSNDNQLGDLFMKELQKRNISSVDDIPEDESTTATKNNEPSSSPAYIPPPQFASGFGPREDEDDGAGGDQLARSRRIGSEGLDGLIPRGSQLLTLGATSFLAFGPFILFVLVSFGAVYMVWGDLFVHGGSVSSGPPVYYDPYDLLAEPTADPMIPM
jgi:hypothetical protein